MICPKCGGRITVKSNCEKCKISYDEMISSIRHDEMKRLFLKADELIRHHKSIELEESLLACELANSSLLIPVIRVDGGLKVRTIPHPITNKDFIMLFTDKEEYDKCEKKIDPMTNPFRHIIPLLDDEVEGFVINAGGVSCELPRKYIDKFFGDA